MEKTRRENISPLPEFERRIVLPVDRRYNEGLFIRNQINISNIGTCITSTNTHNAVSHNKVVLVSALYVTCFGIADHLQAFKYKNLKPKIECIYIYIFIYLF